MDEYQVEVADNVRRRKRASEVWVVNIVSIVLIGWQRNLGDNLVCPVGP
jgi:hypothetical protein